MIVKHFYRNVWELGYNWENSDHVFGAPDSDLQVDRLATVQSGPDHGLFWRLLKRLDCTVQSFVGLDWTVPKNRIVRR
jgi:hypothetical protein